MQTEEPTWGTFRINMVVWIEAPSAAAAIKLINNHVAELIESEALTCAEVDEAGVERAADEETD